MEKFSTYQYIYDFNHSDFRRKAIPQELVSGWPCIHKAGRTLCITIPYYTRLAAQERIALFPIYCAVTYPLGNHERLMDFTIYPNQKDWRDVDYTKPVGYFRHAALADVKTKGEYQALCRELYAYYDEMVASILAGKPFENEEKMSVLFTKLMEPGQYPQYLRINKKFYSFFCRL